MSRFIRIDESRAKAYRTKPLQKKDIQRLSIVVAAILGNHLAQQSWQREFWKGSVTLKNPDQLSLLVKVFVDYDNGLAKRCNIKIHDDPIVVGVELTNQPAYIREVVRDELKRIANYYIDPRDPNNSKWWLKPIEGHKYDILFLEKGPCPFDYDEGLQMTLQEELGQDIARNDSGEEF